VKNKKTTAKINTAGKNNKIDVNNCHTEGITDRVQTGNLSIKINDYRLKITDILAGLILAITAYTYILTPLGGDIKIFFASARMADFDGSFPLNVNTSWEIKPLGNRIFIYLFYKLTSLFTDYQNKLNFEPMVKLIYATVAFAIIALVIWSQRERINKMSLSPFLVFSLVLLSFYSLSYWSAIQVEDVCNLILLISLPLALSKNKALNIISGAVLSVMFAFKGITLLMSLYVFIILLSLGEDYWQNIKLALCGMIVSLVAILFSFVYIFPNALTDLLNATLFQDTMNFTLDRIPQFITSIFYGMPYFPLLLVGFIISWSLIPYLIYNQRWKEIFTLYSMWLIGAAIVLIQGRFFAYHYLVCVIPCIYSILLLYKLQPRLLSVKDKNIITASALWTLLPLIYVYKLYTMSTINISLLLILGIVFISYIIIFLMHGLSKTNGDLIRNNFLPILIVGIFIFWAIFQSYFAIYYPQDIDIKYTNYINDSNSYYYKMANLNNNFNLSAEPQILYLDNGYGSYYLGAPSYCRYFYILPVQRTVFYPKLQDTQIYKDTLNDILSYDGRYIINWPDWFNLNSYDTRIKAKINSEYTIVDNETNFYYGGNMVLYERNNYLNNTTMK
jgi:hypothetical protein